MKTFCCRFKLENDYFTPEWVFDKNLTKEIATEWAIERLRINDKYLELDEVYEVK